MKTFHVDIKIYRKAKSNKIAIFYIYYEVVEKESAW